LKRLKKLFFLSLKNTKRMNF